MYLSTGFTTFHRMQCRNIVGEIAGGSLASSAQVGPVTLMTVMIGMNQSICNRQGAPNFATDHERTQRQETGFCQERAISQPALLTLLP
jgi:hypothetical protein